MGSCIHERDGAVGVSKDMFPTIARLWPNVDPTLMYKYGFFRILAAPIVSGRRSGLTPLTSCFFCLDGMLSLAGYPLFGIMDNCFRHSWGLYWGLVRYAGKMGIHTCVMCQWWSMGDRLMLARLDGPKDYAAYLVNKFQTTHRLIHKDE